MNVGKIFEQEFKESITKYNKENDSLYLLRLTDSATGFGQDSSAVRFSARSPYDFLLHQKDGKTFALELKSCAGNSITFSFLENSKMVKYHQIINLEKAEKYGIIAGFLLNFRKFEETYFWDISSFLEFTQDLTKKSFNRDDVKNNNGILIPQQKKKVKFTYDIQSLLNVGANYGKD